MGCCESKENREPPPQVEMQVYPVQQPVQQPQPYYQPPPVGLQPPPPVAFQPPPQQFQPQPLQPPPIQGIPSHFVAFFTQYNIQQYYWNDLMTLANFDITFVADDSGSMRQETENGNTRWSELVAMLQIVVTLGGLLDSDGIDVIFLNRGARRNVTDMTQISDFLREPPSGKTPLSRRVREAMALASHKPQLLLIATDGQPESDATNQRDPNFDSIGVFSSVLANERNPDKTFVSIIKCSNSERETGYLDQLDHDLRNLDVIDDYLSEREEVLRKQGHNFVYTPGDNIARLLLGSIYPRYDNMDEKFVE